MPNNVLNQLRTLRDGIAEDLRRDPRYQTLQSLDKSIAEITNVLAAAGILPPGKPASSLSTRLSGLGPSLDSLAEPAPAQIAATRRQADEPQPDAAIDIAPTSTPHPAPLAPASTETVKPGFKDGTVSQPPAAVPNKEIPLAAFAAPINMGESAEAMHGAAAADEGAPEPEITHDQTSNPREEAMISAAESVSEAGDEAELAASERVFGEAASGEAEPAESGTAHGNDLSHPPFDEVDGRFPNHAYPAEAAERADAHRELSAEDTAAPPKAEGTGYAPMAAKPEAAQYAPSIAVKFSKLPNKVDLRPLMPPVADQGEVNCCVADAVAGAYEYWIRKASKKDRTVSRLFVHYNARWRDGAQHGDGGSAIQLAMEGLQRFGACSEAHWPFDARLVPTRPGAEAYCDGAPFRIHDMARVPLRLEAWKQALAEGKPIVFGIELFESFGESADRGGVVPMPAPGDFATHGHGGHCLCAVGYSAVEKVFIVRNDWGTAFGEGGYCYMPFAYVLNPKFNDGDCWVFVPKMPSQPPREAWLDDGAPVTNGGAGVDFEIEPYAVEDYQDVPVDLFEHARRPWNAAVPTDYGDYAAAVSKSLFSELASVDLHALLASTDMHAGAGQPTSGQEEEHPGSPAIPHASEEADGHHANA